jgi:putative tryptophan/tyrosine transport system substrate-binding protein
MSDMRRRQFITLVGGAAAWPLAARAQQSEGVRRIGVLMPLAEDDAEGQARLTAFLQGLRELGWTDGRNVRIDTRWTAGQPDEIRKYAAEFAALAPEAILAAATPIVAALQPMTHTVPIVFVLVSDPVAAGFVDSLSRPGGNITGFMNFEYGVSAKWLELLKEIAPGVTRAGVLRDPAITAGIGMFGAIQSAAPSLGVEVSPVNVRDPSEMERGITAFARFGNGGLIVTASALTRSRLLGIARSTRQSRCRASAPYRAAGSLTVIRQRVRGSAASVSDAEWSVNKSSQSTTSPTS